MKNILFIVTGLEVGGIETYLLRFLKFSKGKIKVTVLCKRGRSGVLEKDYLETGACIIKSKLNYIPNTSYIRLYRLMKKEQYDTVCDFTGDFSGFPLFIASKAGIKNRLCFYRGSTHRFKQDKFRMAYNKLVNALVKKYSTTILSNSEAALNFFHQGWKENNTKYKVIRNGIPVDLFEKPFDKTDLYNELGIPKGTFIIGHVGRFDSSKNHKAILKVAESLCNKYDNVCFLLCGLNVEKGMHELSQTERLNSKIIMPGLRDDIPNILRILDAYYFPSVTEGQPNALIEAMSLGLPFVASDIAPIKETVPVEYHRYLVNPSDTEKVIELLESFIDNKYIFASNNLAKMIKLKYNATKLFGQFYNEL